MSASPLRRQLQQSVTAANTVVRHTALAAVCDPWTGVSPDLPLSEAANDRLIFFVVCKLCGDPSISVRRTAYQLLASACFRVDPHFMLQALSRRRIILPKRLRSADRAPGYGDVYQAEIQRICGDSLPTAQLPLAFGVIERGFDEDSHVLRCSTVATITQWLIDLEVLLCDPAELPEFIPVVRLSDHSTLVVEHVPVAASTPGPAKPEPFPVIVPSVSVSATPRASVPPSYSHIADRCNRLSHQRPLADCLDAYWAAHLNPAETDKAETDKQDAKTQQALADSVHRDLLALSDNALRLLVQACGDESAAVRQCTLQAITLIQQHHNRVQERASRSAARAYRAVCGGVSGGTASSGATPLLSTEQVRHHAGSRRRVP